MASQGGWAIMMNLQRQAANSTIQKAPLLTRCSLWTKKQIYTNSAMSLTVLLTTIGCIVPTAAYLADPYMDKRAAEHERETKKVLSKAKKEYNKERKKTQKFIESLKQ